MFVAFVDLSKAFDILPREMLWRVLSKVGCPPKFVNLVMQFHDGIEASVLIDGQHSEKFEVTVGVKQGCVLAPILFDTYLTGVSYLVKEEMERLSICVRYRLDRSLFDLQKLKSRTKTSEINFIEQQYADNCALLAHSEEDLRMLQDRVNTLYGKFG